MALLSLLHAEQTLADVAVATVGEERDDDPARSYGAFMLNSSEAGVVKPLTRLE